MDFINRSESPINYVPVATAFEQDRSGPVALTISSQSARLSNVAMCRVPLLLTDVQNTLIGIMTGNSVFEKFEIKQPVPKHLFVLVINNIAPQVLHKSLQARKVSTCEFFEMLAEFGEPTGALAMCTVQASYGNVLATLTSSAAAGLSPFHQIGCEAYKDAFDISGIIQEVTTSGSDPRVLLQLPSSHLTTNGLKLGEGVHLFSNYVKSHPQYQMVSADSLLFSAACKVVGTTLGNELASFAVVEIEGNVIINHLLVKPEGIVTDYRTSVTGFTAQSFLNVSVTLSDVQREFQEKVPSDAILVWHSGVKDIAALKISHPYLADTQNMYRLYPGNSPRHELTALMYALFNERIPEGQHSCVEVARWTMRLARLKLDNGPLFGNCHSGFKIDMYRRSKNWYMLDRNEAKSLQISANFSKQIPQIILPVTSNTSGSKGSALKRKRLQALQPQLFFQKLQNHSVLVVAEKNPMKIYKQYAPSSNNMNFQGIGSVLEAVASFTTVHLDNPPKMIWAHAAVKNISEREAVIDSLSSLVTKLPGQTLLTVLTSGHLDAAEQSGRVGTTLYKGGMMFR